MGPQAWVKAARAALLTGATLLSAAGAVGATEPAKESASGAGVSEGAQAAVGDESYTFAFYDMPLIDALQLLAARSGRSIAVSGPAQDAPIDARFISASFEKALNEILRSRQHVVLSAGDGSVEVQLLDAPAALNPTAFDAGAATAEGLGLLPLSDEVIVPEKPEGIGFRPGGLSLGPARGAAEASKQGPQD
jgi:hypothetical protein